VPFIPQIIATQSPPKGLPLSSPHNRTKPRSAPRGGGKNTNPEQEPPQNHPQQPPTIKRADTGMTRPCRRVPGTLENKENLVSHGYGSCPCEFTGFSWLGSPQSEPASW
jgi:hypothetical protein